MQNVSPDKMEPVVHQKHIDQARIDDILNTEDGDFEEC
jgi:hypothetical protein